MLSTLCIYLLAVVACASTLALVSLFLLLFYIVLASTYQDKYCSFYFTIDGWCRCKVPYGIYAPGAEEPKDNVGGIAKVHSNYIVTLVYVSVVYVGVY